MWRRKHFLRALNRWRGHRYLEQTKSEKKTTSAQVKVDGAAVCVAPSTYARFYPNVNDVAEI